MAAQMHPAAPHHIPAFIVEPGQSDILMIVTGIILMAAVIGIGLLFFRLHTLPERVAHRTHKIQFEIVAILGLLALFTHQHIFWVIGLILAFIEIPDFLSPLRRIAGASEKMAGIEAEAYADPHEADSEPKLVRSKGK